MNAQCIMVCSGKGGTGKSTVSVLWGLPGTAGPQDPAGGAGLRSAQRGHYRRRHGAPFTTLEDVLCGRCEGAKAVVPSPLYPGLSVISAPYEGGAVEAARWDVC